MYNIVVIISRSKNNNNNNISILIQENQALLFDKIIQFNPGKLQKGGGTGLGLYSKYIMM